MSEQETSKVGRRGTVVIPAEFRRRYGMEEGSYVIAEATENGVLLRPAAVLPVEVYSAERKAAFLLTNAVDEEDYDRAKDEVRRLGLDPDAIEHEGPGPDSESEPEAGSDDASGTGSNVGSD